MFEALKRVSQSNKIIKSQFMTTIIKSVFYVWIAVSLIFIFGILISQGIGEVDKRMFEYDCILGRTYNAVTESDISTIINNLRIGDHPFNELHITNCEKCRENGK